MNEKLLDATRKLAVNGLKQLPEDNVKFFKRIFSHGNPEISIEDCVDSIPEEKLVSALDLVERTLAKKIA